jgi:RNA polymerase sigma-B factor
MTVTTEGEFVDASVATDRDVARAHLDDLLARRNEPGAQDELVRLHAPLVDYLARRFAGRGEPLDDLTQVANIGLLKALERFDADRGVAFATYATPTIIGELKRHFRDRGWAIRVPRRLQELGLRLRTLSAAATQELGRAPTVAELAERADVTEEDVLDALDAMQAYATTSLDAPLDDDGHGIADSLGSEDESLELLVRWHSVADAIGNLPERERRILGMRFIKGLTQSEIAAEIGISQMHVSRLLVRTLAELRKEVSAHEDLD